MKILGKLTTHLVQLRREELEVAKRETWKLWQAEKGDVEEMEAKIRFVKTQDQAE
jgi:hypothetical protein